MISSYKFYQLILLVISVSFAFCAGIIIISSNNNNNVKVLHLYSAICIASEALLVNHLYSAPSKGRLRQCRPGFVYDTLRLLPPYAGT